jgi:hypothetical protein
VHPARELITSISGIIARFAASFTASPVPPKMRIFFIVRPFAEPKVKAVKPKYSNVRDS